MSFWSSVGKVAIGVAAGVGTVAALPVLGPIGAVTAVGAVVGAGVGAAAGAVAAVVGGDDDPGTVEANQKLARMTVKHEEVRKAMARVAPHVAELKKHHEEIVGYFAVAFCAAHCDGEILPIERQEIEELITGVLAGKLPKSIENSIHNLYESPPTISEAFRYIEPLDRSLWESIEDIVDEVIHADGIVHPKEAAFLEAWALTAHEHGYESRLVARQQHAVQEAGNA